MPMPQLDVAIPLKQVIAEPNNADKTLVDVLRRGDKRAVFLEVLGADVTARMSEQVVFAGDGAFDTVNTGFGFLDESADVMVWNVRMVFEGAVWDTGNMRRYSNTRDWIPGYSVVGDTIQTPIVFEGAGYRYFMLSADRTAPEGDVYEGLFSIQPLPA